MTSGVARLRFKMRLATGGEGGANREFIFIVSPVLERASASDRGRMKCNSLGNQDEAIYFYPFFLLCRTHDRGRVQMVKCNSFENQDEAFTSSCLILATPMRGGRHSV